MAKKNRTPLPGSESFEALGKVWHLAPLGPRITDAFAAWCRMCARRNILRDKTLMAPSEFEEEYLLLRRQIDAGEYEWGPPPLMQGIGMAPGCLAFFKSEAGKLQLLRLMLEPAHGELSDEEINALAEGAGEALRQAFDTVFFSAYPWLRREESAPGAMRPTKDEAPTPETTTPGGEVTTP